MPIVPIELKGRMDIFDRFRICFDESEKLWNFILKINVSLNNNNMLYGGYG